ncbi:hypothetical protein TNCV_2005501 [Trichonephila clavipes]|nr:hypothetical protein TNCV_2005501 [Trichonephila clavipes]
MGKPDTPYLQHQPNSNVSLGTQKRLITSRLTGKGSLLPPIYSEAQAKGNTKMANEKTKLNGKRVENREGSLGYPWVVVHPDREKKRPAGAGSPYQASSLLVVIVVLPDMTSCKNRPRLVILLYIYYYFRSLWVQFQ